jgi:DNA segregation ATPase FtsK/SpoIIIE, S-DNA-T family
MARAISYSGSTDSRLSKSRRASKAGNAISDVSARFVNVVAEARWMVLLLAGLFLLICLLTYTKTDSAWSFTSRSTETHNAGGRIGAWASDILLYLFGITAYLWAGVCAYAVVKGYRRLKAKRLGEKAGKKSAVANIEPEGWRRILGVVFLFVSCLGLEYSRLSWLWASLPLAPGGMLGQLIGEGVHQGLGAIGGTLSLVFLFAVGLSLCTGLSWLSVFETLGLYAERLIARIQTLYGARQDRQIGVVASEQRKEDVEVIRQIIDDEDDEPLRIEPQVVQVVESDDFVHRSSRRYDAPTIAFARCTDGCD